MAEIRSFYFSEKVQKNDIIQIKGSDFHHIRNVLRLQENDTIAILTANGKYLGKIISFEDSSVRVVVIEKEEEKPNLPHIHLIQGIPKGWKMDEIIEKSTEMGVSKIYPIYMDRSIPKFSAEEEQNKRKRWDKIAIAASKQSRRNDVPQILPVMTFKKQIQLLASFSGSKILFWELEQKKSLVSFLQINRVEDYLVMIGPEGGISYEEASQCEEHGFESISLGDTILRTETAAPFAIGLIKYLWTAL